jgi:hypothetical protein
MKPRRRLHERSCDLGQVNKGYIALELAHRVWLTAVHMVPARPENLPFPESSKPQRKRHRKSDKM